MKKIFAVLALLAAHLASATVPNTTSTVSYTCGVTHPYTFKIFASTDLVVTTNTPNTLALTTDYTVTGAGVAGGGNVVLTAAGQAKCVSPATILITRTVPNTQAISFRTQGTFSAALHEAAFDKLTMEAQQEVRERQALANVVGTGNPNASLAQVTAADTNTLQTLAQWQATGPIAASNTLVTATGSPTPRTLAARAGDVVNVKDFGAKGDGTTDDTAAIQAAITAAYRGTVFFPVGIFNHTGLTVTDSTALVGSGWEFTAGTILQNKSLTNPGLTVTKASMAGFRLSNLMLLDQQASSTAHGILFHSEGNSVLDHVYIYGSGGHGLKIVGHTSCLTLRNVFIQGSKLDGIYGRGESSAQLNAVNVLSSQISQNLGNGINLWPSTNFNVKDCTIQGNSKAGIYFNADDMATTNASGTGVNIAGNYFEANPDGAISGLTAYAGGGTTTHYLTKLHIYDNYMHLSAAVASGGTTAIMTLDGPSGSYGGLYIGRNTYNTDTLKWIDFKSAHDYRTTLEDDRIFGETFASVFTGYAGITIRGYDTQPSVGGDRGDASVTLYPRTSQTVQLWATTLTANRTVTLSSGGAVAGDTFRIVRSGLGAFTLDVGGLKTIPSATAAFVDVMYSGSAWVLTGYGTL